MLPRYMLRSTMFCIRMVTDVSHVQVDIYIWIQDDYLNENFLRSSRN